MNIAATTAITITGSFAAAISLTWVLRNWLQSKKILDSPNQRSLHDESVVTGGGAAVALVALMVWALLRLGGWDPAPVLLIPVVMLSAAGLLDDVYNTSWLFKLSLQILVAVIVITVYGPFSSSEWFGVSVEGYGIAAAFSVLWIVTFTNIYNFMDGIDGLAGGYGALCACVAGAWFALAGDAATSLFLYGLMAACLGFLIWNWSPAKIFLGDTGSMMLGGTLAVVAIVGQRDGDIPLSAFVLLYSVFIADTGYTLVRRALRGEKIWLAHREHIYQRAVQTGMTHSSVTGCVLLLSVVVSVLAWLEMARVDPRFLWPILSLAMLYGAMNLVIQRERKLR